MIKKILLSALMLFSLMSFSSAFAEESNASVSATAAKHIETAQSFITEQLSDPSAAIVHLKNARSEAEKLQGDTPEIKHAKDALNQAMIAVKSGDNAKAAATLNAAVKAFGQIK